MTIRAEARRFMDLVSVLAENQWKRVRGEVGAGRLTILDDAFPHLLSSFRVAEFNWYLEHFRGSEVHSTGGAFKVLDRKQRFEDVRREYALKYPHLGDRAIRFHRRRSIAGTCAYILFLANAHWFLPYLRRNRVPFVFTLYPGGGFRLDQERSDGMLREVFDVPEFRRVIVTQKISRDYLIDRGFVDQDRIEFIFGCVLPTDCLVRAEFPKRRFQEHKDTFDICFVAFKYMEQGKDKGYDIFIETARRLAARSKRFRFHVVGPFGPDDMDVSDLREQIRFHGHMITDEFPAFYAGMDIILSPNVPFLIYPGAFDGFPTGACTEAGICGVAVFCTDPLKQNVRFHDREEIVVVEPDPAEIENTVWEYFRNPDALYCLSEKGMVAFRNVYERSRQMDLRCRVLRSHLIP